MEPSEAEELAKKIVLLGMTVKDTAATKKPKTPPQTQTKPKIRDIEILEQELSENIGHKTLIEQKTTSKGKITISYSSKDEREAIIAKLLQLKNN
jgi:ParB-like chromosome segregation protein Spo0J